MITLRITWDEIEALIKKEYRISDIKLLRDCAGEGKLNICEMPEYVEGELKEHKRRWM